MPPDASWGDTEALAARLNTHSHGESGRLTIGVHASLSAGNLRDPSSTTGGASPISIRIWSMDRATI